MVERFAEELHAAGLGQGVEALHDFRGVGFELFDGGAGHGDREAEAAPVSSDQIEEQAVGGNVAMFGDAFDEAGVEVVVKVGGVGIEDGVLAEAERLVDLEVQAYGGHEGTGYSV